MNAIFSIQSIILTVLMVSIGSMISIKLVEINKKEEIPNIWIGLGVLFTFISFVLAFSVVKNWNSDNLLNELIPNISAAFLTSILGMAISKGYTIYLKDIESKEEQKEGYESPEMVLKTMRNIMSDLKAIMVINNINNEKVLNRITDTFDEFAGQVGSSISTNIESVISDTMMQMKEIIKSMGETIEGNVNEQFKQQQLGIKQLTESGTDLLEDLNISNMVLLEQQNASHKELLKKQAESSKEISSTISENLTAVISSFEYAFKDNVTEITKVFDRLEKWSAAAESKNKEINEKFANVINLQTSKEDEISKSITIQREQLKAMADNMSKLISNLENLPVDAVNCKEDIELMNSKFEKLIEKAA